MLGLTLRSKVFHLILLVGMVFAAVPLTQTAAQGEGDIRGRSLAISGILQDENGEVGTFQGTVTDVVATGDGDVVALGGMLNGLATIDDQSVRVANEEFSSPVTPSVVGSIPAGEFVPGGGEDEATPVGFDFDRTATRAFAQTAGDEGKCDVLFLNIEPITLNLLGLEVLTSPITVDINAIPGEGNLLGNLICALAGLLDGTPDAVSEITDQLNEILSGAGVAPVGAETPVDAASTPDADSTTEDPLEAIDDATEEEEADEEDPTTDPDETDPDEEPEATPAT